MIEIAQRQQHKEQEVRPKRIGQKDESKFIIKRKEKKKKQQRHTQAHNGTYKNRIQGRLNLESILYIYKQGKKFKGNTHRNVIEERKDQT